MINRYEHFFSPEDGVNISFATNFEMNPREEYQDVIVFNNGLVCSSQHFKIQVDYLDKLGYKILIHDYRGHFQSKNELPIETITFKNIAKDLSRLFKHSNIKSTHLIGHSMGVSVSAIIYLNHPELVKSMTFIAGTLHPMKGVGMTDPVTALLKLSQKENFKPFKKLTNLLWETNDKNLLFRKIIRYTGFNAKQVDDDYIKFYLEKVSELGLDLFTQLFFETSELSLLSHIPLIKVPCLSIAGEKDFVIPHYLQKATAKEIPNGHYHFIKNGSHVPQIDFPEIVNERLGFFLTNFR